MRRRGGDLVKHLDEESLHQHPTTTKAMSKRPVTWFFGSLILIVFSMTLIVLVPTTTSSDGLVFKESGPEAFAADRGLSDEECYRFELLRDTVERPRANSRDIVDGLKVSGTTIVGDFDNLPEAVVNPRINNCIWAIGSPSIAVGDVNGDGAEDIVRAPDQVWVNKGDATFYLETLPVASDGLNEDVGPLKDIPSFISRVGNPLLVDLDNDGRDELVTTVGNYYTKRLFDVYRRGADGTWTSVSDQFPFQLPQNTYTSVNTVTALDYDGDGWTDLALGWSVLYQVPYLNAVDGFPNAGIVLLRNLGGKGFEDTTELVGIWDALSATVTENIFSGYRGRFWEPRTFPHSIVATDLDGDSRPDLVVAGDYGTGVVLYNDNGKRFITDRGTDMLGFALMGPAFTDENGDGLLDLFVSQIHTKPVFTWTCPGGRPCSDSSERGNLFLISEAPRLMRDRATQMGLLDGSWGWGAAFVDLDNDGVQELVQAAGYGYSMSPQILGWSSRKDSPHLWRKTDGRWVDVTSTAGLDFARPTAAVAAADFDGDGRQDLVFTNQGSTRPKLFLNKTRSVGNWLTVDPVPVGGVGASLGARIEISHKGKVQWTLSGLRNTSYMSNGDRTVHFGVGDAQSVDISITWPDGSTQKWRDVITNQRWRPSSN
jgi:hypothetical protein